MHLSLAHSSSPNRKCLQTSNRQCLIDAVYCESLYSHRHQRVRRFRCFQRTLFKSAGIVDANYNQVKALWFLWQPVHSPSRRHTHCNRSIQRLIAPIRIATIFVCFHFKRLWVKHLRFWFASTFYHQFEAKLIGSESHSHRPNVILICDSKWFELAKMGLFTLNRVAGLVSIGFRNLFRVFSCESQFVLFSLWSSIWALLLVIFNLSPSARDLAGPAGHLVNHLRPSVSFTLSSHSPHSHQPSEGILVHDVPHVLLLNYSDNFQREDRL